MSNKEKKLRELDKKFQYTGIILNERPKEMSFEDYKDYLYLQKEYIKKRSFVVWPSAIRKTFIGNINEYIKEQELKQQLQNAK